MKIHEIHSTKDAAVGFLLDAYSKITDAAYIQNYHPDYSHLNSNFFYVLEQGRYRQGHGKYFVVTDNDKYVCSCGWNEYDLEPTIALVLTRMYVSPEYRARYIIGNTVLPLCITETEQYQRRWITANEHNRTIYDYFVRAASGKRTALCNDWPSIYKQFKPLGIHTVYYTKQYVAEYTKDTI
jgi:hypothetical protein